MGARHADRLWAVAGVLATAALLAVGWFLLVGPQKSQTGDLHDQVSAAQDEAVSLQRKLADLRRQEAEMPRYEAELAANRKALPQEAGTPEFIRQMQRAGDAAGVEVSGVTVGDPRPATGGTYELPISLTAAGGAAPLEAFLDQLQRVQPRAVLIDGLSVAEVKDEGGSTTQKLELSVNLSAFVAPNIGK